MKIKTQKEIAEWAGLKEPFLSQIFHGKKRPSSKRAAVLEKKTGVSLRDWLLAPPEELKKKVVISYQVHNDQEAAK